MHVRVFILCLLLTGLGLAQSIHDLAARGSADEVERHLQVAPNGAGLKDGEGRTPLHAAARRGDLEIVQVLLRYRANPAEATKDGWTPLHEAAVFGHVEIVRALLAAGAKPDPREKLNGGTPLHIASFNGHLEVVRALIAAGADVNARDKDNWTPLSQARDQGFAKVEALLKAHGGKR